MGKLRIGEVYRYGADKANNESLVDGLPNFFAITRLEGKALPLLEKGISQVGRLKTVDAGIQSRTPVVIISSSPHNRGSEWNPWQDTYEPDLGYVRYFGDAKGPGDPSLVPGNKLLLAEFEKHSSGDKTIRSHATPILFFERVKKGDRVKGNIKFHGFGVIERVELVTQFNPIIGYFTNYVFQFCILSLTAEDEQLDWDWINDRREAKLEVNATLEFAPEAWKRWINLGNDGIDTLRRRVSKASTVPKADQLPESGTREAIALKEIYDHYTNANKKHRFELLASRVVMSFVNSSNGNYHEGWITRGSGDGGVDFVGKLRVGAGFSGTEIVVLGQAKCEKIDVPTNGQHLARTVSRLRRGWIGAYVTTSYFSNNSQVEILEDEYPLIKINGKSLAEHALKLSTALGYKSLKEYLEALEVEYPDVVQNRRPEDILRD